MRPKYIDTLDLDVTNATSITYPRCKFGARLLQPTPAARL